MKSILPLHLDPPSQLGFGEGSTPALDPASPGIDTHSGAFGGTGFAGDWGCSADKVTLLAGTQVERELLEDGIAVVLAGFRTVLVEDRRLGLGSLLHCTGHSGTLRRRYSPISALVKVNETEGY